MTPQERLAAAMRELPDEIVRDVAIALQRLAKEHLGQHGVDLSAAFDHVGQAADDVLTSPFERVVPLPAPPAAKATT